MLKLMGMVSYFTSAYLKAGCWWQEHSCSPLKYSYIYLSPNADYNTGRRDKLPVRRGEADLRPACINWDNASQILQHNPCTYSLWLPNSCTNQNETPYNSYSTSMLPLLIISPAAGRRFLGQFPGTKQPKRQRCFSLGLGFHNLQSCRESSAWENPELEYTGQSGFLHLTHLAGTSCQ